MKKLLLLTAFLFALNIAQSQTPSILWRFNTHDAAFGNAAIADVDNDGKPEIIFSCYWGDSNIYVLNAEDGTLLWKRNMNGCNDAAPLIYDVDHDGQLDVLLGSSCNPVLTCFNGLNGTTKWQTPFGGTDSPLSIANIDADPQIEILVGDFEGYLNCFYAQTGILKWKIPVDTNSAIESSPALVDVNNDTHPDIIVGTWAYGGNGDSTAVYAYDGLTHNLIWENRLPTDKIYHGAAFADVDEDGKPELAVTCYDGNVYLLNGENGSVAWQHPTPGGSYIGDPATIGDLDNDGHLDLVYSNGNGEVEMLDRFGNMKWNFFMSPYESNFRGASLADINNDDTLDVIFGSSEGKLYALNGSRGNLLWSLDLRADYGDPNFSIDHCPVVSSFKNDDTLDVFIEGGYADYPTIQNDFGRAYGIKVGKGFGPDWVMFQHDYTRSNCVCNPNPAGVKDNNFSKLEVSSYPNPFTENINFNVSLEKSTKLKAAVFNMEGIEVKVFADEVLSPGNYQFTWNGKNDMGTDLPSGIYYYRISTSDHSSVKKIVLVR